MKKLLTLGVLLLFTTLAFSQNGGSGLKAGTKPKAKSNNEFANATGNSASAVYSTANRGVYSYTQVWDELKRGWTTIVTFFTTLPSGPHVYPYPGNSNGDGKNHPEYKK
jgi:hypothetical protein